MEKRFLSDLTAELTILERRGGAPGNGAGPRAADGTAAPPAPEDRQTSRSGGPAPAEAAAQTPARRTAGSATEAAPSGQTQQPSAQAPALSGAADGTAAPPAPEDRQTSRSGGPAPAEAAAQTPARPTAGIRLAAPSAADSSTAAAPSAAGSATEAAPRGQAQQTSTQAPAASGAAGSASSGNQRPSAEFPPPAAPGNRQTSRSGGPAPAEAAAQTPAHRTAATSSAAPSAAGSASSGNQRPSAEFPPPAAPGNRQTSRSGGPAPAEAAAQTPARPTAGSATVATPSAAENPIISSIAFDSRDVKPGSLFFALKGIHTDGHKYIRKALEAGAAAVIHSDPLPDFTPAVPCLRVADTRQALSKVSAAFWNHPSRKLKVIGVTGTDGKSTTVSLIRQLLTLSGVSTGSISTVNFHIGSRSGSNIYRQSTPEAPQIHELLHSMLEAGHTHAVLEATSHGLSPKTSRLADVEFHAGVFTNVTEEHLEFHGNLENYRRDKSRLFEKINSFGVINGDSPHASLFRAAAAEKTIYTYSIEKTPVFLRAENLNPSARGTSFTLSADGRQSRAFIPLPGLYNVENALAALCAAAGVLNKSPLELAPLLQKLHGVKGRMETVSGCMDFDVIVDYAHSPGSFRKILPFLKSLTSGRLIVVFGSGGERDIEKRPAQGALAAQYADVVFLTDEDPRGEDSMDILRQIAAGALREGSRENQNLFLIPDRYEAIKTAFQSARPGDLVAALGKGHEKSIIYAGKSIQWDEAEACRKALKELGYSS